jgi:hypothetical protein
MRPTLTALTAGREGETRVDSHLIISNQQITVPPDIRNKGDAPQRPALIKMSLIAGEMPKWNWGRGLKIVISFIAILNQVSFNLWNALLMRPCTEGSGDPEWIRQVYQSFTSHFPTQLKLKNSMV